MIPDATTVQFIGALAALIAALTGLIGAVQNWLSYRQGARNASISRSNNVAIAEVGAKVDGVSEQTNGHMTSLIAAVAPIDVGLAAASMVKLQAAKDNVQEKLDKISGCGGEPPAS